MNILITGLFGQLGWNLAQYFKASGHQIQGTHHDIFYPDQGLDSIAVELNNPTQLSEQLRLLSVKPETIIHCAAFTNVTEAELHPQLAQTINVDSTITLVEYAKMMDIPIVYISTDYVFDGHTGNYNEEAKPNPLGVYGRTKLEGEYPVIDYNKGLVLRLTPLAHQFRLPHHGKTIFSWILEAASQGEQVTLFEDKICSPVTSKQIYKTIDNLLNEGHYGLFHMGTKENFSLYEIGKLIEAEFGLPQTVTASIHQKGEYSRIRPKKCNLKSIKLEELEIRKTINALQSFITK